MADQIEDLITGWAKYVATGAIGIVVWLGGHMMSEINDNQRVSTKAMTDLLIEMATIKDQIGARSVDSLHQAAQIEDIRTQLIDLRMRVNTIEQHEPHAAR